MKKAVVFTVLFILLSQWVIAQAKTDSIEYKRNWFGYTWVKYNGKQIKTMRELKPILKPDSMASSYLLKAKHKHTIGVILASSALIYLAATDISIIATGPKNNTFYNTGLFVGFGVAVVSIPFSISARVNFRKAIITYDSDLRKTGFKGIKPEYYLSLTGRGAGIIMRF
jgi:hypothetical protein